MKKIVLAASLLMISASAHAASYNYDGVTVHIGDGCRSSSCVSVYAPGYGSYNGGHATKVRKARKDNSRVASARKEDAASPTPAAPPVDAAPAKTPDAAAQAAPSDAPPVK